MQWVAALLAAAAGFASGAVWYMTLAAQWKAAVGKTDDDLEADKSALPFVIGFAASLLTAGLMRHLLASSGVGGIGAGFVAGLGIGVFMFAPWILTNYAFAGRPRALWWIDAGHVVLACTAIGTVLGLFL